MSNQYYVRCISRGTIGNSPVWYGKGGAGYTPYLQGAEIFSKEDADRMEKEDPEKWKAYPCEDINARLHLIFDVQDRKKLGTSEPPSWHFGYTTNPTLVKKMQSELESIANPINKNDIEEQIKDWMGEFDTPLKDEAYQALLSMIFRLTLVNQWILVSERMPEKSIRVIGAQDGFVVGDCYFGAAPITVGKTADPEYMGQQLVECWRYTDSKSPIPNHLIPTLWRELPDTPNETMQKNKEKRIASSINNRM